MRAIKITLMLLSFISTTFAQNKLIINDLNAGPGDTAKIIIALDNTDNVSGVQFKIKVPTDLVLNEKEAKFVGRNTDHVIYPKSLGNGEYLFLCFSGTNANLNGQTGGLIEIPIQIPLNYLSGQSYNLTFTESIVSSNNGVEIGTTPKNGILNIKEGKNPDLKVGAIIILQNDIIPNATATINWVVQNIGLSSAVGGWREQISLVSQSNGKKYIIGNDNYESNLIENTSVNRTLDIKIPAIIGFDGAVKIEIVLIANSGVLEPSNAKENNTAVSAVTANLVKKIIFSVNQNEILENSVNPIRVNISRSGDTSSDEVFTITSDANNAFNLPTTLAINKNESSNSIFIKPIDNATYEGDRKITLIARGTNYSDENLNFKLLDDEKIVLSIDYVQGDTSIIGSNIAFTLNANFALDKDQNISISTDQFKRLQIPNQLLLAAGSKSVTFAGTILDPKTIEKSVIANVYAKADGFTSAIKEVKLSAINIPTFTLALSPNRISEGGGVRAVYATLKKTNQLDKKTVVQISANKKEQLILPNEILFDIGQNEKIFSIGVVDNSIVEGEREVAVSSQIKFESCSCVDANDLNTVVKQNITILDNDGLALQLKISPSTIKAGATNNKLTISRNTEDPVILQNPVVVNLSSDAPTIMELPNTVTIPTNQKEIEITFNTKIDPNQIADQSIRVQAEAVDYGLASGWILISNQNKADVIITKITANSSAEAASKIAVHTFIKNQGNSSFSAKSKIDYYLSKNTSISNLKPFVSSVINTEIAAGDTFEYVEELQLPNFSGEYNLIAVVNADNSISELDYQNNQNNFLIKVLPSYTVSLSLSKKVYKSAEIVKVFGNAKTSANNPVPNANIAIKIKNSEFEKKFDSKTDAEGNFVYDYTPLENESGSYTITASFPGEEIAPQESFELLGFEIVGKPQYIKWETLVGEPLLKEFIFKNKTNIKLTGVKIQLPVDADFTIEQTPLDIEPGATIHFPYKIKSTIASTDLKYVEYKMEIQSNEGAKYSELIYYYSKNQVAKLVASPISINTTMVKDQSRSYEFTVKNVGAVDAENVELLLPDLGWLRLQSQKVIERIKPDEEIKIALEFQPTVKEQLNTPITGNFVIKQKTGDWLTIPFRLETVSESTGKLVVDATDEFTYNTVSAPHLKGAKVTVKHPFTGAIIAEGLTNEAGLFEIPKINEGWYVVNVTADKHNSYQNNILVDPGKDTRVVAFLQYKAVTYSWDVKPTEIVDEYEIKLDVKFETNVPVPVIIMEVDNPKLDLNVGESRLSYITITNHGLIAAKKISISAGELSGYSIKPLITSLDQLNAKSSIIIPVLIKNISTTDKPASPTGKFAASNSADGCSVAINLRAVYICDTEKEMFAQTIYVKNCNGSLPSGGGEYWTSSGGGPGGPSGNGGCYGCGGTSNAVSSTLTSFPDFCDPCINKTTSTILSCVATFSGSKAVGAISCAFDLFTATSLWDMAKTAKACVEEGNPIKGAWDCGYSIGTIINDCLINPSSTASGGSGRIKNNSEVGKSAKLTNKNKSSDGVWGPISEDFDKITMANKANDDMLSEYINDSQLDSNTTDLTLFVEQIANHVDNQKKFTDTDVLTIKDNLKNTTATSTFIDSFVTRWNLTVDAWNASVFSPNVIYSNIVNKIKIDEYKKIKGDLKPYAFTRGFVSVADMYNSDLKFMDEFMKEKSENSPSVCASVTIEFPQKLTMTRQAFEGTLKINNSSSKSINDINLELVVTDENGENKTHLFQINKEVFLNGTGMVGPDADGQGLVTFIPTKEAAPEVKKSYSFGGILSYFDPEVNERVNITLNSVTLEVNPSPDLVLHYFMQRDILGDDPLTSDVIEPSVPAELSLMIKNDGFGLAKNVNVESMQPKIIENEKGLLVNFNLIGSNFNNEPKQLGLLNVNFGDIQPKKAAVGQWFFTSSLIGHFVKYDVKVSHKSSFGNSNLSLIKAAYIHELIKSVKSYGTNSDAIADFLVNDVSDLYDTPDKIYLSDGENEEVSKAEAVTFVNQLSSATLTAKVKINPSTTGWNYGNILDPSASQYKLIKVVRDSDNFEIPLLNFWQTQVTLKDGLNPKYENKLHVLDKIAGIETYTLYFNPIDGSIPSVVAFIDPPQKNSTTSTQFVKVEFNKEIDFNTFTNKNIELIRQGVTLPSEGILITKINPTTFSINIAALTLQSGFYQLIVKAQGVKDLLGNEGKDGKKIEWLQFLNELGILKFETDQVKKQPLNSITIIFNKPIRSEEFTSDKITINNNSVNNLDIQKIDDYNYTISGINPFNKDNGTYTIAIDVTKIKTIDGISGIAKQSYDWIVDNNLPKVLLIKTASQGGANTQNITELEIEVNRKLVSKVEPSALQFTKNGQKLNIPVIIQKMDDTHYKVFGLGSYTTDNATYRVTLDQSILKDENENFGEGIAEASWTVRLVALNAVSNVRLTPDRGSSAVDNITSGDDILLNYKTLEDNLTVEVSEILGSGEELIDKQLRVSKGEYGIPIKNRVGAKKFKVVGIDANGNRSNAEILGAYIDFTDIAMSIEPVNEVIDDCTDFDYVNINFSDEITDTSFSLDAITLKSAGAILPNNGITINKISDKKYRIDNIQNPNDGSILLEIDKTKITKKLSGLNGFTKVNKEIGSSSKYPISITGEDRPDISEVYTYTATSAMNKYDWIILNGEIQSSTPNTVTVKWNKVNAQSIILRYKTPLNCSLIATKEVIVADKSLGVKENEVTIGTNFIYPVPNKGQFTINTNIIMYDCVLEIYDTNGKRVYQENHINFNNKTKDLNVNLSAGTYLLILYNKEEKLQFKFIIK